MAMHVLENEFLKVSVADAGAELSSVMDKESGLERIHDANPQIWNRHAPILFPFVGKVIGGTYRIGDKEYDMKTQHGFARDMEFTMISKTDTTIWFALASNEETLKKFPFTFVLHIGYELCGNELRVLWKVENPSAEKTLHFGIGAHPAFNCPLYGEDSKAGYKLYFGGIDALAHHGNDLRTGLSLNEDLTLPLENNRAVITPEFFDRCTYIAEGNQTKEIGLEDPQGNRILSVLFDMPLFGIWSPERKNAPFLCIEPWYGRCDAEDFEGTLSERAFNNTLEQGKIFQTSYIIRFGN